MNYKTLISLGPVCRNVRGLSIRRAVLWITGRDLLEPTVPILPQGVFLTISGPLNPRWEMTLSADAYLKFSLPIGPNILHRIAQRFVLGIRWRMLPNTPNVEVSGLAPRQEETK